MLETVPRETVQLTFTLKMNLNQKVFPSKGDQINGINNLKIKKRKNKISNNDKTSSMTNRSKEL